ncbi:MAG: hypothetical protein M3Q15_04190 [Pseudomonadota bacterium]|nr:hypothetical protein [Pseudomonadota bacterium]
MLTVTIPIAIYEVENERWSGFDTDFGTILLDHFGRSAELRTVEGIGAGAVLLCAVLSLFGMYRFRQWGRLVFLLSFLIAGGLTLIGPPAAYASRAADLLEMISSLSGGALLAMAYAKGLGTDWYSGSSSELIEE